MKPEIKHIIPYLPYDISALIDGVVCEIEGIDLHSKDTIIAERVNYKLESVKLVLRPLSDLVTMATEIDIEFRKDLNNDNYKYLGYINYSHAFHLDGKSVGVLAMPYFFIENLLENHFDIFGGIGTWAIDINKLK